MDTRLSKSLAPASRAILFLRTLRQECLPLDLSLQKSGSTIRDLGRWMKGQKFKRSLRTIMKYRREIHEMTASLTQYWAISQLAVHLREQLEAPQPAPAEKEPKAETGKRTEPPKAERAMKLETVLELLRKLGAASTKPTKEEAQPLPPAFVHPDVPKAEQAAIIELLTRDGDAASSKKAA